MKFIPLSQGKFAIVDDADFEWLNQWKWYAALNHRCFYAVRRTKGDGTQKTVCMHREILALVSGDGLCTDHINHDGLDNRRFNLRICTKQQNQMNQRKPIATKSSQYKGVYWDRRAGKWKSYIKYNGKLMHICMCDNEQEAALAYDSKAKELFGDFACLNVAPKKNTEAVA